MRLFALSFILVAGTACTNNPAASDKWQRYTVSLSGHTVHFSSPPGSFQGEYVPEIDLTQNKEDYVTLFNRSWIFSALIGDAGMLELIIALNRGPVGTSEDELLQEIQKDVSNTYNRFSKEPVIVENVRHRELGGKQWVCYDKSVFGAECALRIDTDHYLTWRLKDINNRRSQIDDRDELRAKIEKSVEVAF